MSKGPDLPGLTYLQHLGSGGYADVYLYEQASPRMNVAVKVLRAEGIDDDVESRFTSEADVMARLSDHPFIVPVMAAGLTDGGQPFIVMKYYPKPNLAVRARRGQFSVPDVLRIGIQVASAVETAHRAGILHRDIKPANILTSQYDEPGLTDFGIAVVTADGAGAADGGMSLLWAAPEVMYGVSDGDVRSDVYALGATLWHLLAGRPPYEEPGGDNSELALMRRTQSERVPAVPRDGVPESLQRLLRQALAKSADGRQQSALALARGLQAVEQELHLPVTQTVIPEDDRPAAAFLDDEPDEPATRVRGARVVAAQPASAPEDPDGDAATRLRATVAHAPAPVAARAPVPRPRQPAPAEPVREATTPSLRKQVDSPAVEEEVVAPAKRSRAAAVTAGLVAAVVLVVGVVVVVANGSGSNPQAQAADQQSDPQDVVDVPEGVAPGTPRITIKKVNATTARFVFAYDDAQPGDALKWTRVGAGVPDRGATTKGFVDLKRPTCLTVRAVRRSGLSSPASAAVCAP